MEVPTLPPDAPERQNKCFENLYIKIETADEEFQSVIIILSQCLLKEKNEFQGFKEITILLKNNI